MHNISSDDFGKKSHCAMLISWKLLFEYCRPWDIVIFFKPLTRYVTWIMIFCDFWMKIDCAISDFIMRKIKMFNKHDYSVALLIYDKSVFITPVIFCLEINTNIILWCNISNLLKDLNVYIRSGTSSIFGFFLLFHRFNYWNNTNQNDSSIRGGPPGTPSIDCGKTV